jgi:hypothetical protein
MGGHGWRPAWINDLQGDRLESGVFTGSPGRPLVERLLARLPEEGLGGQGQTRHYSASVPAFVFSDFFG